MDMNMFEIKIGLALAQDKSFISNLCKEITNLRKGLLFEYSYLMPKIRIRDEPSILNSYEFAIFFYDQKIYQSNLAKNILLQDELYIVLCLKKIIVNNFTTTKKLNYRNDYRIGT